MEFGLIIQFSDRGELGRREAALGAGGLGVSLRVTVIACARGHALPTCPPARQRCPRCSFTGG